MSKNNMVPSIRFKEFTNAWEQERLGEIVDYFNGSSNEKEQTNEGKFEIVNLNSISISGELKPSGKFLHNAFETLKKGDIVMILSDIALGNLLGKSAVIPVDNRYVLNQRVALLRKNNSKFNSKFISLFLNKNQSLLFRKGAGSSQLNLSKKEVINFLIFSTSRNEQDKVSLIFNNINSLITLHQRKLNALENLKKTLLEKMFPSENSVFPSIRFKEFTNAWEQERFENIYQKYSVKNNFRLDFNKYISIATNTYKNDFTNISKDTLGNYILFKKGYVAFEGHTNIQFPFGRFVMNTIGDGIVSNIFSVFKPVFAQDLYYWKYAINNNKVMLEALKKSSKSGIMMNTLDIEVLNQQIILFPNQKEQNLIGLLFVLLDSLIALHQRKLNALENLKKTLLEKMFV
ncbi:restriction endonuclease subunit S [Mycoplasmopsis cynos]|uniref:Restriction endonuclease subunit S n=1 Tax=Mycoplasmopsis cynos TaxID=171284 RepID=A0ABD8AIX6_9BACT|nr:restriction endonuclease subunit S [Mycoplasmopsis cynos]UWV80438.1 restriction endonuclease subunit S [Mycoplasmopsis cynos]WAM05929.1 restriction endonuclease subunit S [Mycoplasmopsis cynos]WQQ19813.1 restriction endonuclease subunit S [Mycoplasmopsis cynos]